MKIEVLDTTLRDGEQTPGISLTKNKKLRIATKLDEIGVNSIEAGSAITSSGEREAIKEITSQGFNAEIVSFARTLKKDIDFCIECDVDGVNIVVPTSDLHLKYKLKKTQEEMLNQAVDIVEYTKDHGLIVELSAEDSTRTDINYLNDLFKATIEAGADRICPCDTVGMLTPLKSFNFYKEFETLENGRFKDTENVEFFGIKENDIKDYQKQVKVLYYNSNEDFAIKLLTKEGEEVILNKKPDGKTFNKSIDAFDLSSILSISISICKFVSKLLILALEQLRIVMMKMKLII